MVPEQSARVIRYFAAHPLPAIVFLGALGFLYYVFLDHILGRPMQSRSDPDNSSGRPKSIMGDVLLIAVSGLVIVIVGLQIFRKSPVPSSPDHAPAVSETTLPAPPKLAPPPAPAPSTGAHVRLGAIAYSPSSGAHGYASDYSSQADAEAHALAECKSKGDGCKSAIWFRNACGALAVGPDGSWGSDWGPDQQTAEQNALGQCKKYSRGGCSVIRWACTTR